MEILLECCLDDLQHSQGEAEGTETNGGAGGVGRSGVGGLLGNGGCSCGNGSGEDDGARGGCHDGACWSGSIATAKRLHDGASSGSGGGGVEGSGGEAAAGENLTDIVDVGGEVVVVVVIVVVWNLELGDAGLTGGNEGVCVGCGAHAVELGWVVVRCVVTSPGNGDYWGTDGGALAGDVILANVLADSEGSKSRDDGELLEEHIDGLVFG